MGIVKTVRERQFQETDRRIAERGHRRGAWGPAWAPPRKFEGWSTKGGRALARQMIDPKPEPEPKPKPEPKPEPEPEPIIVRMVEAPSPHHASQFAADIIEPSYSELIHDRRVLDLLPVIEDQTSDPFWDEPLEFMPWVVHERTPRRHGT
jgi:hypothetical protein